MLVLLLGDVWVERISFVLHAKEAVAHEVGELRRKASGLEEFSKPRPAEVKRQPTMAIIKETNAKMQQKRQIHFAVLTKLMLIFLEALQGSFILAYAVQHLHDARGSNLRLQKVYGDALTIPWLSPTVDLQLKVQDFVAANRNINSLLAEQESSRVLSFILVCTSLLRIIGYLTVHPRINFLVATLWHAGDSILHFLLSFMLVFMMLAILAHSTFGEMNVNYSTLQSSMMYQLRIISTGTEIDDFFEQSGLFVSYIVFVYLLQGLLMLNFFLAIIVEAYGAVKKSVDDQVTEQSFWLDSIHTVGLVVLRFIRRWPAEPIIIQRLNNLPSELVDLDALLKVFRDRNMALQFAEYYTQYHFVLSASEHAQRFLHAESKSTSDLLAEPKSEKSLGDDVSVSDKSRFHHGLSARVLSRIQQHGRRRGSATPLSNWKPCSLVVPAAAAFSAAAEAHTAKPAVDAAALADMVTRLEAIEKENESRHERIATEVAQQTEALVNMNERITTEIAQQTKALVSLAEKVGNLPAEDGPVRVERRRTRHATPQGTRTGSSSHFTGSSSYPFP